MIFDFLNRRSDLATVNRNKRPDKAALERARSVGNQIVRSAEQRNTIVGNNEQIDHDFASPGANWDSLEGDYIYAYRQMASMDWEHWKHLRLRAQSFSGFSLIRMDISEGMTVRDPVPTDFEKRWSEKTRRNVVDYWRVLTKPDWCSVQMRPPNMLGEVGWWIQDTIVNVDTIAYQERLNLLHISGLLERFQHTRPRILEIGGGYGAVALALSSALSPSQYVICDLPESLIFSGLYLAMVQSKPVRVVSEGESVAMQAQGEFCLLPNYLSEIALANERFDLVINTLSLSEMTSHQISTYAALVSKAIGSEGVFFEQNHDNTHLGLLDCRSLLVPHFSRSQIIAPGTMHSTRGRAEVWSNA